ncbi:MAG: hypothetical protein LBS50_03815 [Prevotellaceae bacterium]|jgi:tetratricopeptide (TPR) repeat protein|nr:hypothetical protein [Prevotellaceae bacterium]
MADNKKTLKTLKTEEKAGEFISKTEKFFEENQKTVYYVLIGVLVAVVLVIFGYNYFRGTEKRFFFTPQSVTASEKLVWCEQTFARDSFQLALDGDGINDGYAQIAASYPLTKAKNEAALGAATCSFYLGRFDEAIDYAKKFTKGSNTFSPVAIGLIGDCYVEKGELKEAAKYFDKAASYKNEALAPHFLKKAADIYLFSLNDSKKALEYYQTIKDKYFSSRQAADIDKFIELAK